MTGTTERAPDRTEVVVIGGGAIGTSAAYHLARAGARVVLLERADLGSGASFANPGTVSLATKKPGLVLELAKRGIERLAGLGAELGQDIEFERCGALMVAETEPELEFLADLAARQRAAGAPVEILDGARARNVCPTLADSVVGASYCATDAQVNPFRLTYAYATAAERLGVVFMPGTTVSGIETVGERVRSVRTDHGSVDCDWVVNAAGAEADTVAAFVGLAHGVTPRRGQLIVVEADGELPDVKVSSARQLLAKHLGDTKAGRLSFGYALKPRSGTILLGSTNEPVAGLDRRTTDEGLAWIADYTRRLMPAIAELRVLRAWAGLRPYREAGPLVGRAGGPKGYVASTGHGGDGIALSAVTGAYVADIVCFGRDDLSLDVLLADQVAV